MRAGLVISAAVPLFLGTAMGYLSRGGECGGFRLQQLVSGRF
jgi:hypothetical protein